MTPPYHTGWELASPDPGLVLSHQRGRREWGLDPCLSGRQGPGRNAAARRPRVRETSFKLGRAGWAEGGRKGEVRLRSAGAPESPCLDSWISRSAPERSARAPGGGGVLDRLPSGSPTRRPPACQLARGGPSADGTRADVGVFPFPASIQPRPAPGRGASFVERRRQPRPPSLIPGRVNSRLQPRQVFALGRTLPQKNRRLEDETSSPCSAARPATKGLTASDGAG